MPAVLAEDWPAVANGAGSSAARRRGGERAALRYTHPYWYRRGHQLDEKDDKDMVVSVRAATCASPAADVARVALARGGALGRLPRAGRVQGGRVRRRRR